MSLFKKYGAWLAGFIFLASLVFIFQNCAKPLDMEDGSLSSQNGNNTNGNINGNTTNTTTSGFTLNSQAITVESSHKEVKTLASCYEPLQHETQVTLHLKKTVNCTSSSSVKCDHEWTYKSQCSLNNKKIEIPWPMESIGLIGIGENELLNLEIKIKVVNMSTLSVFSEKSTTQTVQFVNLAKSFLSDAAVDRSLPLYFNLIPDQPLTFGVMGDKSTFALWSSKKIGASYTSLTTLDNKISLASVGKNQDGDIYKVVLPYSLVTGNATLTVENMPSSLQFKGTLDDVSRISNGDLVIHGWACAAYYDNNLRIQINFGHEKMSVSEDADLEILTGEFSEKAINDSKICNNSSRNQRFKVVVPKLEADKLINKTVYVYGSLKNNATSFFEIKTGTGGRLTVK